MDFGSMLQTWIKAVTSPNEATFEEERHSPNATFATAIIWILIAGVLVAIFSGIASVVGGLVGGGTSAMMEQILSEADVPPELMGQFGAGAAGGGVGFITTLCSVLIFFPIIFMISSGIYWIAAKVLGGTGSFEEQTYLLATFTAPISIINSLVSIVPILGACISFFISIYQLVLTYFALKVSHNLTSGRAVLAVLLPIIIIFLCVFCAVFGILLLVGPAIGSAFEGLEGF